MWQLNEVWTNSAWQANESILSQPSLVSWMQEMEHCQPPTSYIQTSLGHYPLLILNHPGMVLPIVETYLNEGRPLPQTLFQVLFLSLVAFVTSCIYFLQLIFIIILCLMVWMLQLNFLFCSRSSCWLPQRVQFWMILNMTSSTCNGREYTEEVHVSASVGTGNSFAKWLHTSWNFH